MKSFKNFQQYVFTHLFPYYYKVNDTYKDKDGKGILERFIDVCSDYIDTDIIPNIDNFMDILDVDKTPDIFLNYLWEYFGYIPYAYGVLTRGEPYTKENVARWLNNPSGFPKADTRQVLKYAISLYKIRCTADFYTVLGRFYGVRFELLENGSIDVGENQGDEDLVIATFSDKIAMYPIASGTDTNKAGYRSSDCLSCEKLKLNVYIPKGMYDLLEELGRLEEVLHAFGEVIRKYLPIHVILEDTDIDLISDMPVLLISSPPIIPQSKTSANLTLPFVESPTIINSEPPTPPEPEPGEDLSIATFQDNVATHEDTKSGYKITR